MICVTACDATPDRDQAQVDRHFPGPCTEAAYGEGVAAADAPRKLRGYVYDAAGRPVLSDTFNTDGSLASRTRWRFDDRGEPVEYAIYAGSVLSLRGVCVNTYTDGRLVLSVCDQGPDGPDGISDTTVRRTYDAAGRVTRIESAGASRWRPTDAVQTFTYDAAGRVLVEAMFDLTGTPVARTTHTYDATGHEVREVEDDADPTTPPHETHTTWDTDGRVEATVERFADPDGLPTEIRTSHTYDAAGHLVRSEARSFVAGEPSVLGTTVTIFTYDAEGRLRSAQRDEDGWQGSDAVGPPTRQITSYDAMGNPLRVENTSDGQRGGTGTLYTYSDTCWPRP